MRSTFHSPDRIARFLRLVTASVSNRPWPLANALGDSRVSSPDAGLYQSRRDRWTRRLERSLDGPVSRQNPDGATLLFLTPAIALGLALFLQQFTRPIAGMRAGLAPLVVAVSLIAMPCLARVSGFEKHYRSEPTPRSSGSRIRALDLPENSLCVIPDSIECGPGPGVLCGPLARAPRSVRPCCDRYSRRGARNLALATDSATASSCRRRRRIPFRAPP